eukprot:COSAG02_NODE_17741_length_984_cov_1.085876_1_plen_84_part_00
MCAGANKHVGPTFVVVFGPLQIVFTAILQLLIFDTPVSKGSFIGGSLVSFGLFMLVAGRAVEESKAKARNVTEGSEAKQGLLQ